MIDLSEAGARQLNVVGDWLTVVDNEVWLAGKTSKNLPIFYRLSPSDGSVVGHVNFTGGACSAGAIWKHLYWTATCTPLGIAKIDPRQGKVVKLVKVPVPDELDGETTLGTGEGGIWVVVNSGNCVQCRIAKLDADLHRVRDVPVTSGAANVRVGLGSVWVSNPDHGIIEQIDPATMRVIGRIRTGARPRFIAVGAGSVWALAQVDGTITRYTPATKDTVTIPAGLAGAGGDMTFADGSLWVRGAADRLLIRIDAETNQIVEEYGPAAGAGAVAVGFGAVWISAYNEKKVWRVPLHH